MNEYGCLGVQVVGLWGAWSIALMLQARCELQTQLPESYGSEYTIYIYIYIYIYVYIHIYICTYCVLYVRCGPKCVNRTYCELLATPGEQSEAKPFAESEVWDASSREKQHGNSLGGPLECLIPRKGALQVAATCLRPRIPSAQLNWGLFIVVYIINLYIYTYIYIYVYVYVMHV